MRLSDTRCGAAKDEKTSTGLLRETTDSFERLFIRRKAHKRFDSVVCPRASEMGILEASSPVRRIHCGTILLRLPNRLKMPKGTPITFYRAKRLWLRDLS